MKRQKPSATSINNLPDEILQEILFKLPIKSTPRSQFVSKKWSSLTSSPTFVKEYVSRKLSSGPSCTLLKDVMNVERSNQCEYNLDLVDNNKKRSSSFSVLAFPRALHPKSDDARYYNVLDSSNGLLLCKSATISEQCVTHKFYVCNPICQQWIELPETISSPFLRIEGGLGFTTQLVGVSTITSYKVVILPCIGGKVIPRFEILSSESGKWTSHDVDPDHVAEFRLDYQRSVAVVNRLGILHWFDEFNHNVLAYKPMYKDSCRLISLPLNYDNHLVHEEDRRACKDIDAFDSNLRYLEIFREPGQGYYLCIWTLKDYENGGIWHFDHKISLCDQRFYAMSRSKRCRLGQFDANIIYIWLFSNCEFCELLTYDFRAKNITLVDKLVFKEWDFGQSCLPLLLPIWPPTLKLGK